ncbi:site-specific DNA-methyltransferase [Geothermobacter hydrogeniphilus]|uniref:site-specific DNA-methyltransferase (adenine-specific) n=1 Tax=Geothermobacter hydrogeniphilus TaxID=1969733 RepID=A0A2K2HAS6_9BACT|nr:site-specific DNA-methyltransferase [Geothermobacter hydrogeniphilus]PNU20416.1 site-specific DNA-methyltransferase [Geothermobacter hydrogeniphilus]
MSSETGQQLTELLLSLVPADGTSVGNKALERQFHEVAKQQNHTLFDGEFERLREGLIEQGTLLRGKGRGGSVRLANPTAEFSLQIQEKPPETETLKPAPSKTPAAKASKKAKKTTEKTQVIPYRHLDNRKNNPEVGMVTPVTDPATPPTTWSYDPHLDPALQFDVGRSAIEKLIDDALDSGDQEMMRTALEELKRLQAPYLNWTGKAERTSFEVDTVSLHVHERIDPMSILSAVRKQLRDRKGQKVETMVQAGLFEAPFESVPFREAVDFYRHERGWANRLVAGDSLLVMNSLLQKESMAGQVQMIYIDPPYGIKYGSNFQPFVGKRDVKDRKDEDLTQEPEMIKAFRDTWELGIHSYLTYLRDRLLLAKELLSESGSVFVQISDENVHFVRNLLGEIFGEENFVAQIAYKTSVGLGSSFLDRVNDYVVWFGKNTKQLKYRQLYVPLELGEEGATRYSYAQLPDGKVVPTSEIEESTADGVRFFTDQGLTSRTGSEGTSFPVEYQGVVSSPTAGGWRTGQEGMRRVGRASRILTTGKGKLRFKKYFDDFGAIAYTNFWADTGGGIQSRTDPKIYAVQTATTIIERCLLMTTDPGDLVLDPTCGSGTTAYVAEKWGRRWITCDTSRVAVTLAKQRLMTASFDYYELKYPHEGLKGGFIYKTVPHITLKSIANNPEIDEIYERMHPAIEAVLAELNNALTPTPLPKGEGLKEWEVPFEFPDDWPAAAQVPFDTFHKARQAMQQQMDASIATHADQEILYDQPQPDRNKLRITGPFTVEAVPFPTVLSLDEAKPAEEADVAIARSGESSRQHQWRDELLKTGIRGKGGQLLRFAELESLPGTEYLHASGHLDSGERVVVSFGPEHAALEQRQVELALREAGELFPLPQMIVYCAFTFDPEAAKDIDQLKGITALKAQMNTDLLTEDLKKGRASNQSFWLMGQPDVEVRRRKDGQFEVEVNGFDYFDTKKGELVSGGKGKIAMWLLDTDYDERSLFPRQVFFPMAGKKDGWHKLKKNIRAELNEELLGQYHSTVSLPFDVGDNRKVAVKIIDDRGIESLKILALEE